MISLQIGLIQAQLEAWKRMISKHMLHMVPRHEMCEGHFGQDSCIHCINRSERLLI